MLPAVRDIRRAGSAALDLAWLAAGRLDAYYERGLNAWDWAAGSLLVREAGGAVEELARRAVRPDRGAAAARGRAAPARRGLMDVAVIGGGIVGVAAAAFLAEGGAEVTLAEQAEIGAGASGRNSGAVQHPFDPALTALHEETVAIYRELDAPGTTAFPLDRPPDGLLSVAADPAPLEAFAADVERRCRSSTPQLLEPAELEPSSSPRSPPACTGAGRRRRGRCRRPPRPTRSPSAHAPRASASPAGPSRSSSTPT